MKQLTIYEQPLKEHIRVCLRLEQLFHQLEQCINHPDVWASRSAVTTILEILDVVDRPDIKNKFAQALGNYTSSLTQLESNPNVDKVKLHSHLMKVDSIIDELHTSGQKMGKRLRENQLLHAIRQHSHSPGGACNFNTPAYYLWQQGSDQKRTSDLQLWSSEFVLLQKIVSTLLSITRKNQQLSPIQGENGFYQQSLDSNAGIQLIRVGLSAESEIYPVISVGRHRLSITFFTNCAHEGERHMHDLEFMLSCCRS